MRRTTFANFMRFALVLGGLGTALLIASCKSSSPTNASEPVAQATPLAAQTIAPPVPTPQPGSEFLGVWMADGTGPNGRYHQSVRISPAGAAFLVVLDGANQAGTYPTTYQGGLLHSSLGLDVAYLPDKQAIMFMGGTFVKTTEEIETSMKAKLVSEQQQVAAQQQAARDLERLKYQQSIEECKRLHPKSICM